MLGVDEAATPMSVDTLFAEIGTEVTPDTDEGQRLLTQPHSPLRRAWHLCATRVLALGGVIAGKLLTRERPSIAPIYDRVVVAAVDALSTPSWWACVAEYFSDPNHVGNSTTSGRRRISPTSAFKFLDIAIWVPGRHGLSPR